MPSLEPVFSLSLLGHYTNWWCNVVYSSHAVAKAHSEVMKTQFSKFQMIIHY